MEIQKTQKVKASQKILSFMRNEREKGKETYIIHRSDRGMKEIPVKPPSEFDKKFDKTRINDGILEEDEIEDLDKVYEQVKKFIENKHGTSFRPSYEDVKKYMEAYLAEKNKKINKNAFNSYLNCKKIREEYMKSKIEKRQEKKRMRELAMHGIIVKEIKPEVELNERDKKLLNYFHKPYAQRPNTVNVNLRISQYNKKKVDINKECQILQKECNDMIKDQLVNANKSFVQGLSNTNESFFVHTPIAASRAQTAQNGILERSASRNYSRSKKTQAAKFNKSVNNYYSDFENENVSLDNYVTQQSGQKTKKKIKFEGSLDLSPYNMAEKCEIDLREKESNFQSLLSGQKNLNKNLNIFIYNPSGLKPKRQNIESSQVNQRRDHLNLTKEAFYTPSQTKYTNNIYDDFNETQGAFLTQQANKKSALKKVQKKDLEQEESDTENNVSYLEDKFVRKTMISMVTGKPIRPYLQLQSLADKIEMRGKERKQREKTKILDDNKLRMFEEFRNFNFSSDQKNIPNTHSNFISQYYMNMNQQNINPQNSQSGQGTQSISQSVNNSFNNGASKQQRKSFLNAVSNQLSKTTTARQSVQNAQLNKEKKKSAFNNSNDNTATLSSNQQTDTLNKQSRNANRSQGPSSNGNTPNNAAGKENKKRSTSSFEIQKNTISVIRQDNIIPENTEYSFSHFGGSKENRFDQFPKQLYKPNNQNEKKNDSNIFTVNQRFGQYQKLTEKINNLRKHTNFKPGYWEEMKMLDEQIEREKDITVKIELRKKQQLLGRKQFQALKQKEDEEEEIKAQKFEKLVQKTQYYENKLISQFEDIKKTKQRKNEEFKFLIETLNRDRPMTRDIRLKNYNLSSRLNPTQKERQEEKEKEKTMNLSLNDMREKAEEERKKILESNCKQVEWYQQSVNKLAQLSSNEEDMSICHLIMDQIKQILEDGIQLTFSHIQHALTQVEENPKLLYNSNSLYCVELSLSLFFTHITDLQSFTKLQEAYFKKQNQKEKSHKTEASSTIHSTAIKQDF
ncbi:hypothetical protein TTHERM_00241760 (macronuclear) [Tetrahymena thermophila SB210]|uniref:Uncharacterized protein n=1 Tax=Tetrahymena thermophila (strain SB210) TaxID=312017 RepID=I7MIQ3_TETTS|nr:hypothetical protein TTHERM_00241760 [Tetrahymena thermophila SB210]EAS04655.3 hypothetical protein TTHERM_00241760 [Tetrahymena thermophila SB210]|eukprot:XP_001024900.3 hypothetical protein TTHERM_00241760 [Tetrahymena thermophila SB210]